MKSLTSALLTLLLIILCGRMPAQNSEVNTKREADSLSNLLRQARSDTARIMLRSELGLVTGCFRPGYWDSLISDARSSGSLLYEGRVLSTAARVLMREPHEKAALRYNELAYAIAQENGDQPTVISCLINWAYYYCYMRNNASVALDYCFKGLMLASQINDDRSTNRLIMLAGTCYFAAGEYKKALAMHLKCLEAARKKGNAYAIVSVLTDIGSDYHGMRDFVNAAQYYLECKKYLPGLMSDRMAGEIASAISSGHLNIQQYDSAVRYAGLAVSLARKGNDARATASALSSLAGVQYTLQDYKASVKTATEALEIARHLHSPLLNSLLATILEMSSRAQGDYEGALKAYKLYVTSRDSLSSETNRKRLMAMEFNYTLDKKESENRLLTLELQQHKYLQVIMSLLVLLTLLASYLFFRQSKLRSEQESNRLSQKLLRLQMNPHFIFNSLQAIQSFIVNRDIRESVHYLGAFSNVTRHVLENSRTEYIPIHKEIDLMENYLQLQQLRFMNRFAYVIHADEGIGSSFINIPPMLLQPFIENAVEHGMHDLESGGRIEVRYRIDEDLLFMEIMDNGYGIAVKSAQKKQHRSLALEITRERIALMNKREKIKTTFTITDAFPEAAERKGVKVVFRFSLLELQKMS